MPAGWTSGLAGEVEGLGIYGELVVAEIRRT